MLSHLALSKKRPALTGNRTLHKKVNPLATELESLNRAKNNTYGFRVSQ